jgi:hypothetical protein
LRAERELIRAAKQLGFTVEGTDGSGHIKLHHQELGINFSLPSTPSEWRGAANSIAHMERLTGRKLPRSNSGHYRFSKVKTTDTRRTEREEESLRKARTLEAKAAELQALWEDLVNTAGQGGGRKAAHAARKLFSEYEEIRSSLARLHRPIPPPLWRE